MAEKELYTEEQVNIMQANLSYLTKGHGKKTALAEELQYGSDKISKLINGSNKFNSDLIAKISKYFGINENYFININLEREFILNQSMPEGLPTRKEITDMESSSLDVPKQSSFFIQYKVKEISLKSSRIFFGIFLFSAVMQLVGTLLGYATNEAKYYSNFSIIILLIGMLIYALLSEIFTLCSKSKTLLIDSSRKVYFENKKFYMRIPLIIYIAISTLFSIVSLSLMVGRSEDSLDWLTIFLFVYFLTIGIYMIVSIISIKSKYTLRIDYRLYYLNIIRRYSAVGLLLLSAGYSMLVKPNILLQFLVSFFSLACLITSEIINDHILQYYDGYRENN